MNPLLLVDWRSVATAFTALCWLAVLVLAFTIVATAGSEPPSRSHRTVMVAR